jgi:hypothetical protein
MSKLATLLLLAVLVLSSVVMVGSAFAQSITKPSVPEFTLKYIDLSYDVPPTYGIDQFTGETVITQEGYHRHNQSAVFKIKNQPFNPYTDSGGNNISLHYNFRAKGHFGDEWRYYPFTDSGLSSNRYSSMLFTFGSIPKFVASTSEYTELSVSLTDFYSYENLQIGNQIDFQVQAQIGYIDYAGDGHYSFLGESSGWSETQTITIPNDPPNIALLSPQNETYRISDVPLNFTVDSDLSVFKYSLDGGENVYIIGNSTLTGVAYGCHSITVYVKDGLGNVGASETVFFTVEEPFPTSVVTVSVIILVVVFAVFLLYQRNHKKWKLR